MAMRRLIASFALVVASTGALACEFDDNLAAAFANDMNTNAGVQTLDMPKLRDGSAVSLSLRYASTFGTPKAVRVGRDITVHVPRSFVAEMLGWADVFSVCSVGACPKIKDFTAAYQKHTITATIPTWINVLGADPEICARRNTPTYGQYFQTVAAAGMLFIQLHEIGHAVLGHLKQGNNWTPEQEAAADAFAEYARQQAFPDKPAWRSFSAVALLPLMHRKYRTDGAVPMFCRLVPLLGETSVAALMDRQNCIAYQAAYQAGLRASGALIGPETQMLVTP